MENREDNFFEDFMKNMGRGETGTIYKVHPHFDKYPKYMQDAIIVNERLQGRMSKEK